MSGGGAAAGQAGGGGQQEGGACSSWAHVPSLSSARSSRPRPRRRNPLQSCGKQDCRQPLFHCCCLARRRGRRRRRRGRRAARRSAAACRRRRRGRRLLPVGARRRRRFYARAAVPRRGLSSRHGRVLSPLRHACGRHVATALPFRDFISSTASLPRAPLPGLDSPVTPDTAGRRGREMGPRNRRRVGGCEGGWLQVARARLARLSCSRYAFACFAGRGRPDPPVWVRGVQPRDSCIGAAVCLLVAALSDHHLARAVGAEACGPPGSAAPLLAGPNRSGALDCSRCAAGRGCAWAVAPACSPLLPPLPRRPCAQHHRAHSPCASSCPSASLQCWPEPRCGGM